MNIQHVDNQNEGEFFLLDEKGKKSAKLCYFYETPQKINAHHTFVSETLRGQGVADKLYQALLQFITDKHLTLHPTCSYIEKKWARERP